MSREVPEGWTPARLGEISRPRQWPTIPKSSFTDVGYTVYGANGPIGKYHSFTHERETIAVTCRGATCGVVNLVPAYSYITGNAMALDDIDASTAEQRYLYQLLIYIGFDGVISGSAQPQITGQAISAVEILLPPLYEQRRIAEILSSVDEAIAATRAVIEQTREVKQGVLERLLTKGIGHTRFKHTEIGEIPESWEVGPLSRFGKIYTGKTPSTSDDDAWGGDTPFVTPGDLSDECATVASSSRYVSEHGTRQGRVMPAGAVAVTCIGSTIGKTGILGQQSMTNQQINTICCSKEVSQFVYETCISLRDYLQRISGKQAVPIVNKSTFENIVVAHPPLEEQIEIGKIAAEIEQCRQKQLNTLKRLSLLKSALMSDLLTGRKRVTDALPLAAE